jgi:hypothetical protein
MYGYNLKKPLNSGPSAIAPSNTVAPVISGTAVVGQVLTSTTGTWTGTPTPTYSYQWKRGATNIGTNSSTYTLVQADAGNTSNITCVVTGTNSAGSANATSNTIAQILTVRTSAFLSASAISDATIRGGLNTFDIGLISNGLDTKMKAIYPFVADGVDNNARALQHRWNFMDARDLNAAFRLLFFGGWTHSSTGALPNGTNTYADTNLNDNTSLSLNSIHVSVYLRTNTDGLFCDLGTFNGTNSGVNIFPRLSNQQYIRLHDEDANTVATTDSRGFRLGTRNSSTTKNSFINNSKSTFTQNSVSLVNSNIWIGARNQTPNFNSNRENAFSSIGDGLSDAEASTLYTLVQAFQTTLGRQINP